MIIAYWDVSGETLAQMEAEANQDAAVFMQNMVDGWFVTVAFCKPIPGQIESGQVTMWRGWAFISWDLVSPELLLNTIAPVESSRLLRERSERS